MQGGGDHASQHRSACSISLWTTYGFSWHIPKSPSDLVVFQSCCHCILPACLYCWGWIVFLTCSSHTNIFLHDQGMEEQFLDVTSRFQITEANNRMEHPKDFGSSLGHYLRTSIYGSVSHIYIYMYILFWHVVFISAHMTSIAFSMGLRTRALSRRTSKMPKAPSRLPAWNLAMSHVVELGLASQCLHLPGKYQKKDGSWGFCGSKQLKGTQSQP